MVKVYSEKYYGLGTAGRALVDQANIQKELKNPNKVEIIFHKKVTWPWCKLKTQSNQTNMRTHRHRRSDGQRHRTTLYS